MTRFLGALLCFCCFFPLSARAGESYFQELKGDHFIVFYRQEKTFAEDVLRASEGYYRSIADNLGYARFDNFWTWENRVKIFIFSGRDEFLANTRSPGWSEGFANYEHKVIVGYSAVDGFIDRVLPHEIAHLIFRDYVGMHENIPIWLDEGVALSQEKGRRKELFELVAVAVQKNAFIPLEVVVQVKSESVIHPQAVALFYAEATATIEFLLEKFRRDKFVDFCRNLRDGYGVDESLRRTYRQDGIESLKDLETKLLDYIRDQNIAASNS